jgi:hypothetical protein
MRESESVSGPFDVHVGATMFRSGGNAVVVTITDLSFEGCCITSRTAFEPGERCRLYLPGQGCIDVEVGWFSSNRLGLRFLSECKT